MLKVGRFTTFNGHFKCLLIRNTFLILAGKQPAQIIIFNNKGEINANLEKNFRNKILYCPVNSLFITCGFGNLNGEVDIWDSQSQKKIGSFKVKLRSNLMQAK